MTKLSSNEKLEVLARLIDPEIWEIYDDPKVVSRLSLTARKEMVDDSLTVAHRIVQSGALASISWERAEYFASMDRIKSRTSIRGHCYSVEDGLDGYFMHDPKCSHWPDGAIGGSTCIKAR